MSKLSPHTHPGHHGSDLMCNKVNKAESRWLELTRGLGVSTGLGSLGLMFPELSGEGTRQDPCEGVKLQAWATRAQGQDLGASSRNTRQLMRTGSCLLDSQPQTS